MRNGMANHFKIMEEIDRKVFKNRNLGNHEYSFEAFVELLSITPTDEFMQPQWMSLYRTCDPCSFNFDYINKVETLRTDLSYQEKIGVLPGVELKRVKFPNSFSTSDLAKIYQNVPRIVLQKIYRNFYA